MSDTADSDVRETVRAKIVVHDFAGHAFQIQLSRRLAERGYDVLHLHCASDVKGKGRLEVSSQDPPTLRIQGVHLGRPFNKYSALSRAVYEVQYARAVAQIADNELPDVLISGNTPLLSQWLLVRATKRPRAFVSWQQDVWSVGTKMALARRRPRALSAVAGFVLSRVEARTLRQSAAVVPISPDFLPQLTAWGVGADRITVIENWAPLGETPVRSHANAWSRKHRLDLTRNLLYAGTLGIKHDPAMIRDLALAMRERTDVRVVVVSEGRGANWLATERRKHALDNLLILPYQPYADLPEVLASADVLLAILQRDAGHYSVPSKVLSYHCAGRAILGAIPAENLAARIIERAGSGIIVDPSDTAAFVESAGRLIDNPQLTAVMGAAGREYADATFDIDRIADAFSRVVTQAIVVGGGRVPVGHESERDENLAR
jgi:putative colanic acid biosynthesis glycosyltransferase WcaI